MADWQPVPCYSLSRLTQRAKRDPNTPLEWDKDDEDALDFATAAANLRASVFGIPLKTRFDVKQMAGNIIPAIATTNAIIAGAIILQALHALKAEWSKARSVWFGRTAQRALNSTTLSKPAESCSTCRTPYVPIKVDASKLTLRTFVDDVVKEWLGVDWDISLFDGSRIIYDPDFEDSLDKTLQELGIGQSSQLQVNDEDGSRMPVIFMVSKCVTNASRLFRTFAYGCHLWVPSRQPGQGCSVQEAVPDFGVPAFDTRAAEGRNAGRGREGDRCSQGGSQEDGICGRSRCSRLQEEQSRCGRTHSPRG